MFSLRYVSDFSGCFMFILSIIFMFMLQIEESIKQITTELEELQKQKDKVTILPYSVDTMC